MKVSRRSDYSNESQKILLTVFELNASEIGYEFKVMWSDFCQCKEQALFTFAACLFLWNADQAFAAVEANCSLMQPPSNCPEIPCPRCVRLSSFSRKPYVFKDGNSTDGFLYGEFCLCVSLNFFCRCGHSNLY